MISGSAFGWRERTWMKWMSSPSIVVTNCGSVFSLASAFAPVVVRAPVADQRLEACQLHALRAIGHGLFFGPTRRGDPPAEIDEGHFRDAHAKRSDGAAVVFDRRSGGRRCHSGDIRGVGGSVCAPQRRRCEDENHHRDGDDCGCECDGMRLSFEWLHADLLERMKPDARRGIYQTKVSTTPSYRLEPSSRYRRAWAETDTKV